MEHQLFWKIVITVSALWLAFNAVAMNTKNFQSLILFKLLPMVLGVLLAALSLKLWGMI